MIRFKFMEQTELNQIVDSWVAAQATEQGSRESESYAWATRSFSTTCLLVIVIIACSEWVRSQTPGPMLLTQQNSPRAVALDSVTLLREPLPVVTRDNLSIDWRTRLTLFGTNLDLLPGEDASAITARARDSRSTIHSLTVEFVGNVPTLNSLTQVIVRLPDQLAQAGDVWISVTLRGQTSNEVLFAVQIQTEPRFVTLVARRIVNGQDNYVDACFSFEHGMNGEAALPFTRNDWDVLFGNSPDRDIFGVSMVGDDRSRIVDMGALNWGDSFQVPVLTPHPVPSIEPEVIAVVGHMYAVHTKDRETDLYALFRVEALDPLKSVVISWKSVRSPEVN